MSDQNRDAVDTKVAMLHRAEDSLASARADIQRATRGVPGVCAALTVDIFNAVSVNIPTLIAEVRKADGK